MKDIDLLDLQGKFLKQLEVQEKSFNTIKNYRTDLNIFNKFLTKRGRNLEIVQISETELKEYQQFLNVQYNSPNSIRRRIQALRIFFDFLIQQNLMDHNPIKKMLIAPKIVDIPKPVFFDEVRKFYNYLDGQSSSKIHEKLLAKRNLVLFTLIYGAGLKVSDIENLKINQVNEFKGQFRVIITPDKREPYTVPIPTQYTKIIIEYLSLLKDEKKRNSIEFDQFLFNANPYKILSGGLSSRGIEILFKDYSMNLKLDLSAKKLRQSCIFKWLNQQVPDSRVKERMGVQPQYSLTPYKKLIEDFPHKYVFMEIEHE